MAFYGFKRPTNQIENPVYPDIRKAPERWRNAGKHWMVDMGAVTLNTEIYNNLNMAAGGVLAQDRDFNKQMFGGASSYQDKIVNFRPPLLNYYDDVHPQHMVPCTTKPIFGHLNPTTVVVGGTSAYLADNDRPIDTDKYIIKGKVGCQGAVAGSNFRIDNSLSDHVLPDLELKLPQVSADSGYHPQYRDNTNHYNNDIEIDYQKPEYYSNAGYNNLFTTTGENGMEYFELTDTIPQVSASAGIQSVYRDFQTDGYTPDLQLKLPQISASAGTEYNYRPSNLPETLIELETNLPEVYAEAGHNYRYQPSGIQETVIDLEDNIPQVAASSGYKFNYTTIDLNGNDILQKQVTDQTKAFTPLSTNPHYTYSSNNTEINPDRYIHNDRPQISQGAGYQPQFKDHENALRRQMYYREKLQPAKIIGLEQATANRPQYGIGLPQDYGTLMAIKPEQTFKPLEFHYRF